MADSSPLLPPTPPPPADPEAQSPLLPNLDDAIEQCIGSIGLVQLLQALAVAFAWVFDAQQTFISIFADAQPTWHCVDDSCAAASSVPCSLPADSWAWDQPAVASVVSEWGLGCYRTGSASGLPASAFFVGCLAGGLVLATLGDSTLGRKKMLWSATMAMSLAGILTAFSPNVWVYAGLRFVTGFARATIGTSALVLSTEIVGKKWRGQVSVANFLTFTLGFLSLPAIAYISEGSSWRALYLWTSCPAFLYSVLVFFLVDESPRWLIVRGRREEAITTIKTIARSNGRSLTRSFLDSVVPDEVDADGGSGFDLFSAFKVLLMSRWASRRLAAVMTVAFGLGMGYYGLPLGLGDLGLNLYISVTLNALSELPSSLATFLLIDRLSRRNTVLLTTMASGSASVACVFLQWHVVRMVMEVVAFFCSCTAFNLMLIYAIELFPTCVRNSAVAMVRQALALGGVFAPVLVAAGSSDSGGFLPFGVFGLLIGSCGLFVVCLPETRGGGICDTMEEQENKDTAAAYSPITDVNERK